MSITFLAIQTFRRSGALPPRPLSALLARCLDTGTTFLSPERSSYIHICTHKNTHTMDGTCLKVVPVCLGPCGSVRTCLAWSFTSSLYETPCSMYLRCIVRQWSDHAGLTFDLVGNLPRSQAAAVSSLPADKLPATPPPPPPRPSLSRRSFICYKLYCGPLRTKPRS